MSKEASDKLYYVKVVSGDMYILACTCTMYTNLYQILNTCFVVQLNVFTFSVPCYDICYGFHVKRCSVTSIRYILGRGVGIQCFIYVICIYLRKLESNTIPISNSSPFFVRIMLLNLCNILFLFC